jgi:hypothetical protein
MKLDLNFDLKDLAGNVIPESNCGKIVANTLTQEAQGDALKYWDWALKLHNGKVLELDNSDQGTFKEYIKSSQYLSILLKAQVLLLFK